MTTPVRFKIWCYGPVVKPNGNLYLISGLRHVSTFSCLMNEQKNDTTHKWRKYNICINMVALSISVHIHHNIVAQIWHHLFCFHWFSISPSHSYAHAHAWTIHESLALVHPTYVCPSLSLFLYPYPYLFLSIWLSDTLILLILILIFLFSISVSVSTTNPSHHYPPLRLTHAHDP